MPLQTSGAISFSQIQTVLGGSNPIGINEYYGVGSLPSSGAISLNQFYGQSAFLDSQTVTVGHRAADQYIPALYGFDNWLWMKGSCSDGTSNIYSGGGIVSLNWSGAGNMQFGMAGHRANSGWTTMTVNGVNFPRAYGTYSTSGSGSSARTFWNWSTSTNSYGTTVGAAITVTWS